jgi:hypothetical protein
MAPTTPLAICAVVKNEAPYIEEWLAFHVLQGVGAILIFDNDSTDATRGMLERVSRHVDVDVVDWPGSNYNKMQVQAYDEGARRLAGRAQWAAFIDVDEFLFSSRFRSLPQEVAEFGPEVGAIAVGQRIFGSSGRIEYEPELVTARFTRAAELHHEQSKWFKTIARPELVAEFDSAHSVKLKIGDYLMADGAPLGRANPDWHPGHADRAGPGAIALYHYMVKSLEEFGWKQRRFDGKNLEHRYTEEYFREHNEIGDAVENRDLVQFGDQIRATIASWREERATERFVD